MTLTPDATFSLGDRYDQETGEILVTGIQALVRAPFDQLAADRRTGWRTTAFFSGYQGSPLGGFDRELLAQQALMDRFGAVLRPALNEELGATAVMGSQLAANFPGRTHEGVIGVWYGKGPGVDRAGDAIRHAQFAGTARRGGVLALCGDDPAAKSSTVPCRTEVSVAALGLPVLYPGTMQDVLDLARHGISMSRATGLWTAVKIVTAVADGTGTAVVGPDRIRPIVPVFERNGTVWEPELTASIGPPYSAMREADVLGTRQEMALAYVIENGLNRVVVDPPDAWLTIVAAGHHAELVMDALGALGVSIDDARALGIRIVKLAAITPLEVALVRRAARGVASVLVVEDKQAHLETLVRNALYDAPDRPSVVGKSDALGAPLVPLAGTQTVETLREPLRRVLTARIAAERLTPPPTATGLRISFAPEATRTPFFCSGCPHNTGTKAPDGALVGAGIGCHGMVTMMDSPGRGTIIGITQMGGEGSQWIGIAPFVTDTHMFQNVGDGTFFHSGQLAVQAAAAAGVNVTFKLLYNAAVAMTGGQDATGLLPVPQVAAKLVAEGAKEVVITTDEPEKYEGVALPARTVVWHRDRIVEAQERLREIPGITVLIHDQQCAAEKRRDRKRGLLPTPAFRIVIDERVCEGCGDCGVQSNCLSLQPLDTEFGRKTVIDQASCNLDVSCVKGDCPAFLTVLPAAASGTRVTRPSPPADLPTPSRVVPTSGVTIRMPGIGGTGVVTVAQVLAAAAKIEGTAAHVLDQTGLSQKAGPVVSTVELGEVLPGRVDLLLALDLLVSVTPANLAGLDAEHTIVVGSSTITPTGRMVGKVATAAVRPDPYVEELGSRTRGADNRYADASRLTIGLLGSAVTANVFVLGMAYQCGAIPLDASSIERAIELNGTAVQANIAAFRWGRAHVVDPAATEQAAGFAGAAEVDTSGLDDLAWDTELRRLVAVRRVDLTEYQDARLAERYLGIVRRVAGAERDAGGDGSFSRTVAFQLARLMAYKDEYEVARLLLGSRERIESSFGPVDRITWNLHPPMLRALGMKDKLHLRRSAAPAFRVLRPMRRLRGTAFDPFGRTDMRRTERALVEEYVELVDSLLPRLAAAPAETARVAGLVDIVRGYEDVKLRTIERYRAELAAALAAAPVEVAD